MMSSAWFKHLRFNSTYGDDDRKGRSLPIIRKLEKITEIKA